MTPDLISDEGLLTLLEGINELDVGLTVFDRDLVLIAANPRFGEMLSFPAELCRPGTRIEDLFRHNAAHGEYGPGEIDDQVRERLALAREFVPHCFERIRPDGTIIEVRGQPLAGGGLATIYTDVTVLRQREKALQELSESLERRVEQRTLELQQRERDLELKTVLLEQVMSHVKQGLTLFNADMNLEICNPQFLDLMRLPVELGKPGTPFEAFMRYNARRGEYGPGDEDEQVRARLAMARQRTPHCFERTRPDGSAIEIIGSPVPDGGFVTTYLDISDRKHAEAALRESELRFRDFTAASSDCFFETDAQLRFSFVSERFFEATGLSSGAVLGKTSREIVERFVDQRASEENHEGWQRHFAAVAAHRPYRDIDYPLRGEDGVLRHISVSGIPSFGGDNAFRGYRCTGSNITQLKALENELRQKSLTDPLSGLANRRHFFDRAEFEFKRARRAEGELSMLMVDIDWFKKINDRFGHPLGDRVIVDVAQACQQNVRDVDLVGRLGGEEFGILLPGTDLEMALQIAERIRQSVAALEIFSSVVGEAVPVTISLGACALLPSDNDFGRLMERADRQLYQAKESGRNRVSSPV